MGVVTVTLEESKFASGEVYADEVQLQEPYAQDQRVNMGAWVLASLFRQWVSAFLTPTTEKLKTVSDEPQVNFIPEPMNYPSMFIGILESSTEKTGPTVLFGGLPTSEPDMKTKVGNPMPLWAIRALGSQVGGRCIGHLSIW